MVQRGAAATLDGRVPATATVTGVAHWLGHGEGGYRLVLDRTGSE